MIESGHDEGIATLSNDARTAERLCLLAPGSRQRISCAVLRDGRTVWIKCHDVDPPPLANRLHARVSPLLPRPFLRASGQADACELVRRELRKMRAFRKAGFAVPGLVHHAGAVMVLTHVAGIVEQRLLCLRDDDPRGHDALLVGAAAALGRAHRAGLCHGRPHPRDMFVTGGHWGFIDFEEEPEAVMPLDAAQGRDLCLLFLQVSARALLPGTQERALAAYAEAAPAASLAAARAIVGFFSPLLPLLSLLEKVGLGSDGRRLVKAARFLKRALPDTGADFVGNNLRLGVAEGVKEGP